MKKIFIGSRLSATLILALALFVLPVADLSADATTPLCFTAQTSGATVKFHIQHVTAVIQTSTTNNGTDWTTYTSDTPITLTNVNDKVYFRAATQHSQAFGSDSTFSYFEFSGNVAASGNIMSLYGPTSPNITLPENAFSGLFVECSTLTSAPSLPATSLGIKCYWSMFSECTSLSVAPTLPASTLSDYCYLFMFYGCTSLTSVSTLPASWLKEGSYKGMFKGCTSLTTAPNISATHLDKYCCWFMFDSCVSLTTAPSLPATIMADSCYTAMFQDCVSLTAAPSLPAMNLADFCYGYMFANCSSLVSTPNLPAVTMADYCYMRMFSGCSSLTSISSLSATTLGVGCYAYMFFDCTSLKTIPSITATALKAYCCYGMYYGCSSLKINLASPGRSFRVGSSYSGSYGTDALTDMFTGTTGTMNSTPTRGTYYYIASEVYAVTAISNDTTMGVVSNGDTCIYGTSKCVTATAFPHFHFDHWSNGDTTATTCFSVYADEFLIAYFAPDQYDISIMTNDSTMGTVTGGGRYKYMDTVIITATPAKGCAFVSWNNGSTAPTITIIVTGDTTLTATFEEIMYNVTAIANYANRGTVTGGGQYRYQDRATLIAMPNEGYVFDSWSNGETSQTIYVTVESDTALTANFMPVETGVEDVDEVEYIAYTQGLTIFLNGAENKDVYVYDITGQAIAHVIKATADCSFDVMTQGIYVIVIDNKRTLRVVVK